MSLRALHITLLLAAMACSLQAQDSAYFYHGYDYGSDAMYNPVSLILNGGFDMLQVDKPRDLTRIPFARGMDNVLRNLIDPFGPIGRYGTGNFLKDQVIPLGLSKKDGQWWPNYTLHLIGGGMTYAALEEWYRFHRYEYSKSLAAGTTILYHIVNEAVENGGYRGDNVDPIADIYLFNIGGVILFSSDAVKRFFSRELNLADWSLQPSFSLRNGHLENNGQFFSIKWKLPSSERWHLFYFFGTNGVGGLSYKWEDGSALSFGVGMAAARLITLNPGTNKQTLDLVWNAGLFYDLNNSLLTSLSVSRKTDYAVNLNVYPGVIAFGEFSPGAWLALHRNGAFIVGMTAAWSPAGVALGTRP